MKKIIIKRKNGQTQTIENVQTCYEKNGKLVIKIQSKNDIFYEFDKIEFDNYIIENYEQESNTDILLG